MVQNNQHRLLLLQKMLFEETDGEHKVSIQELADKLKTHLPDMKLDARTIRADLDTLDHASFKIHREKGKFGKLLYSHEQRLFDSIQLRLLIDAVLSADFLPKQEKQELVERLKMLASKPTARKLPKVLLNDQRKIVHYKGTKRNLEYVQQAIATGHVLRFQYGHYGADKSFVPESADSLVQLEPYLVTWQHSLCYLIGRDQQTREMRHFRLDLARNMSIEKTTFVKEPFDLQTYISEHFLAFTNEGASVEIRFHRSAMNRVFDHFGVDAEIQLDGTEHFILFVRSNHPERLENFILGWGEQAEVIKPAMLREQIKKKITRMQAIYRD